MDSHLFAFSFTIKIFLLVFLYPVLVVVLTDFGVIDARIASGVNKDNSISKKTTLIEETGLLFTLNVFEFIYTLF